MAARATHGRGSKAIALRHITVVQLKPVSALTAGYIQFSVPGEISDNKNKGARTMNAAKDENAVLFLKKNEQEFVALRDAIQSAMAEL